MPVPGTPGTGGEGKNNRSGSPVAEAVGATKPLPHPGRKLEDYCSERVKWGSGWRGHKVAAEGMLE